MMVTEQVNSAQVIASIRTKIFAGGKSINQITTFQQIVKLPAVYNASAEASTSSSGVRPTVPAKKPVRQQPPGLKMRFRPIGFGSGTTGAIGSSSSSADTSSTGSTSDEEMENSPSKFRRPSSLDPEKSETSSSSDAEMTDAPPRPSEPAVKSKYGKSAAKKAPAISGPLKRKHSEGRDMKANNSSSSSETSFNYRPLKTLKKKQKGSLVGSQSVLTEAQETKSSMLPRPAQLYTSIPPLELSVPQIPPPRNFPSSNAHPQPRRVDLNTEVSVDERGRAVDSGSSAKEHRKEVERTKKKEAILPKSHARGSTTSTSYRGTMKITPVPLPSHKFVHGSSSTGPSSNPIQSLPATVSNSQEKSNSKEDGRKKEKRRKEAETENWQGEKRDLAPKSHFRPHSPSPTHPEGNTPTIKGYSGGLKDVDDVFGGYDSLVALLLFAMIPNELSMDASPGTQVGGYTHM